MTGIASYLLPLSVFHAAGPGALDKVFGPDGDFEGAPKFRPSLFGNYQGVEGYYPLFHLTVRRVPLYRDARGYADPIENAAFDLRVPSVATRLAGLCAQALGQTQPTGWGVGDANPEWCLQSCWGTRAFNWRLNGMPYGMGLPVLPTGLLTQEAFLSALTLALAPKIAALP
jgi:hypothetical protein